MTPRRTNMKIRVRLNKNMVEDASKVFDAIRWENVSGFLRIYNREKIDGETYERDVMIAEFAIGTWSFVGRVEEGQENADECRELNQEITIAQHVYGLRQDKELLKAEYEKRGKLLEQPEFLTERPS